MSSRLTRYAVTTVLVGTIAAVGIVSAIRTINADSGDASAVQTVRIGNPHARVVIDATEDLQCPYCKAFEAQSGKTLNDLIAGGNVAVDYHIIAFLDHMSSTDYSSRAANASACVAHAAKPAWPTWHTLMFQQQPAEHSDGLTDQQLIAIAKQAGITGIDTCITSRRYLTPIAAATSQAWANGLKQTPTVKVNGHPIGTGKIPTPEEIRAAAS